MTVTTRLPLALLVFVALTLGLALALSACNSDAADPAAEADNADADPVADETTETDGASEVDHEGLTPVALNVKGMVCNACRDAISESLMTLEDVKDVECDDVTKEDKPGKTITVWVALDEGADVDAQRYIDQVGTVADGHYSAETVAAE